MSGTGVRIVDKRVRSKRFALTFITSLYTIMSALALSMLLFVNLDRTAFFTTWISWRFFLTVANALAAVFFYYFAVSANANATAKPSLFAVIFGLVHFIWCFVVVVFTIMDYVNCPTTPWCAVPPGLSADLYFVLWTVGYIGAAVFEFIACILAAQLYALIRQEHIVLKGTRCGAGRAGGADSAGLLVDSGDDTGLMQAEFVGLEAGGGSGATAPPALLLHPVAHAQLAYSSGARFSTPPKASTEDPALFGADVAAAMRSTYSTPPAFGGARKR